MKMIARLLSIEYFKLRYTRYFWVLAGLFAVFLIAVPVGTKLFLDFLETEGGDIVNDLKPSELPIFDFIDIWQNLSWTYKHFSLLLGFIIVISVCNDFSYGTVRQNIIDGLSRREYFLSKLLFILAISLFFTLCVLIIGLISGFLWSPVKELSFVFKNIEFVLAYFLHLVAFQLLCLSVSLLIKRSGIVIAALSFYVYVIEFIAEKVIFYYYEVEWLANILPVSAIGNIIPTPFPKYMMRETQTSLGWGDLSILLVYMAFLIFLSERLLKRKDI